MSKGSELLVAALENEGVDRIFGIPGEENLDVVESLRTSKIELVLTRHEHSALLAEGFLDFVRSKGNGPLFSGRNSGKERVRHASKGVANHLGTWIRERPGFDDPRKAPNHRLRHWWKSAAFKAGVLDSVAGFLQGHRSPSVAARYRHFDVATLAAAVARVPMPVRELQREAA